MNQSNCSPITSSHSIFINILGKNSNVKWQILIWFLLFMVYVSKTSDESAPEIVCIFGFPCLKISWQIRIFFIFCQIFGIFDDFFFNFRTAIRKLGGKIRKVLYSTFCLFKNPFIPGISILRIYITIIEIVAFSEPLLPKLHFKILNNENVAGHCRCHTSSVDMLRSVATYFTRISHWVQIY